MDSLPLALKTRKSGSLRQAIETHQDNLAQLILADLERETGLPLTAKEAPAAVQDPTPLPHQRIAIDAVVAGLLDADRGQLIMACGTGKTFTSLWVKEELEAERTLVLMPSLGLIPKFRKDWLLAAKSKFDVLCVCSDATVGYAKSGEDEIVYSGAELKAMGFDVTSDPDHIRAFLKKPGDRVIFSTYQSSPLIAEAQKSRSVPAFDLVVADEAHRCAGKVDSAFGTVLGNGIRASKRLFATATPRIFSGDSDDVVSMDNAEVFGEVLHTLSFGAAIKDNLLSDYRVVVVGVDDPTVKAWIENGDKVSVSPGEEQDAKSLAIQIGVLKAIEDYKITRGISFHGRVNSARTFAAALKRESDRSRSGAGVALHTDYVSGEMAADVREQKLGRLANVGARECAVVSNARCLSEGIDIAALDAVIFVDPRGSKIDIVQAVGRAIRRSGEKIGTIILPVFIEDGQDAQAAIAAGNFKAIGDVLNALRAHDEGLALEFDQLRAQMGRNRERNSDSNGSATKFSKIVIDLPVAAGSAFRDALRTHLVVQTTSDWFARLGELCEFVNREKRFPSFGSAEASESERSCALWSRRQREAFHKGELSASRKAELAKIEGWSWESAGEAWSRMLESLVAFVELEKRYPSMKAQQGSSELRLARWVTFHRMRRRIGRIDDDRAKLLQEVPGWQWDPGAVDKWGAAHENLVAFIEKEGRYPRERSSSRKEAFKGKWVSRQRADMRAGSLTAEQISTLQQTKDWSWDPVEDAWLASLQDYKSFVDTEGCHPKQTKGASISERESAIWATKQRMAWRRNSLSQEKKGELEKIRDWQWDLGADRWDKVCDELLAFVDREGRYPANTVKATESEKVLYRWFSGYLKSARAGTLSEVRMLRLSDTLGGGWWVAGKASEVPNCAPSGKPRKSP